MSRFRDVLWFLARNSKRMAVSLAGAVLVLAGLVMMVTPGPGLLLIIAGLAVLATEFAWAKSVLEKTKEKASQAKNRVTRKRA